MVVERNGRVGSAASDAAGGAVRVIKRYANRKLYDTGSGELTSLRGLERLVCSGVDLQVVDHDTGHDMTAEVLVGILAHIVVERLGEVDAALLTALIRAPADLRAAISRDHRPTGDSLAAPPTFSS